MSKASAAAADIDQARALVAYMIELDNRGRCETAAAPVDDEAHTAIVLSLENAILRLVNNAARACGVEVGDVRSEVNSRQVDELVGRLVVAPYEFARKVHRSKERDRMDVELRALEAQRDEINERIAALHSEMIDHDISSARE